MRKQACFLVLGGGIIHTTRAQADQNISLSGKVGIQADLVPEFLGPISICFHYKNNIALDYSVKFRHNQPVSCAYKEEYRVEYIRDKSTKRIVREFWRNAEGKLSRSDDLPTNVAYDGLGRVREMSWSVDNIDHRETGPCHVKINPENGILTFEMWCFQGEVHRQFGNPAVIHRDKETGMVTYLEYYDMGKSLGKKSFQKPREIIPTPGF